jgi:hypothetical protein
VRTLADAAPSGISLETVHEISPDLSNCADRQLIIRLHSLGFHAMVSNDRHILSVPEELAALVATRMGFVCVRAAGDNPIKATGALLLELSNLPNTFSDKRRRVLDLHYERRRPADPWDYMERIAAREGTTAAEIYEKLKPSSAELGS